MNHSGRLISLVTLMIVAATTLAACPVSAQPGFTELGYRAEYFDDLGEGRIATIDLDGDGLQELIFLGRSSVPVLLAAGKQSDGSIAIKLDKIVPDDGPVARILGWMQSGTPHILTIAANGTVRDYSGWPLTEQRQFSVAGNVAAAAIGDVDNDGADELLVVTASALADGALHAYGLADGQQQWTWPVSSGTDIAIAQLDADPALEIILGGAPPGIVLDGATRAIDWQRAEGFGTELATGRLLESGGTQWVGSAPSVGFSVFRGAPWSTLWSNANFNDVDALATADLDGAGLDEILVGRTSGDVTVFDAVTHEPRFWYQCCGDGVRALAGANVLSNVSADIAIIDYGDSLTQPKLTIANGGDGSNTWRFLPINGPLVATALGDVDGDGHVDLVAASDQTNESGTFGIFDAESGMPEWRSPPWFGDDRETFLMRRVTLALMPRVGSPGMDIVVAGSWGDGRIAVLDGVTREPRLKIGYPYSGTPMRTRDIRGVAVVNFNDDDVADVAVATQPNFSYAQGALLQVFSGVDGDTMWNSEQMGPADATINGVLVVDPPSGIPGKLLVAALPDSLRAYATGTGQLAWSIPISSDGAFYVPDGLNGGEIGVYSNDGEITYLDAATQQFLRSCDLQVPLRAVIPLDDDLHSLVVATDDALLRVDRQTGAVLATTGHVGPFPEHGAQISAIRNGQFSWLVAAGTEQALYRFHLTGDRIFAGSFETP